jgi:hypothetical protein
MPGNLPARAVKVGAAALGLRLERRQFEFHPRVLRHRFHFDRPVHIGAQDIVDCRLRQVHAVRS